MGFLGVFQPVGPGPKVALGVIGSIAALALGGCYAANLTPLERQPIKPPPVAEKPRVQVSFCTDSSKTLTTVNKTIFVIDRSASNRRNYPVDRLTGLPAFKADPERLDGSKLATDPDGSLRFGNSATPGSLLNYLGEIATAKDGIEREIALVLFSSGASTEVVSGFTPEISSLKSALERKLAAFTSFDSGSTDYLYALELAKGMVYSDMLALGAQNAAYTIAFITDGAPVISTTNITSPAPGMVEGYKSSSTVTRQSEFSILQKVDEIVNLGVGRSNVEGVNLFTLYYYHPLNQDNTAIQLLTNMAKKGKGAVFTLSAGEKIDYRQFEAPPKLIKYSLADVFVTNDQMAFDPQGRPLADTDSDGIPDSVEASKGCNPALADSDGDELSDLVEVSLYGSCTSASAQYACSPADRLDRTDKSGLSACEKKALGSPASVGVPDSNSDKIPDGLSFKYGVPFQAGTDSAADTPDSDGLSLYEKLKLSLPVRFPVYDTRLMEPTRYEMALVSTGPESDCYELIVHNLPMVLQGASAGTDRIRVDIVLQNPLFPDKYLYRVARKPFAKGGTLLRIEDWNSSEAGLWERWDGQ